MTRHRDLEAELHPSVRAARDLRATADLWPQLRAALQPTGQAQVGARTPPSSRPPINIAVSDAISEVASWAHFLARVIQAESDWLPPQDGVLTTPRLLNALSQRTGFFTEHADRTFAEGFIKDCREKRSRVEEITNPSGTRRVPVHMRCLDVGSDDQPCPGSYTGTIRPDRHWQEIPDMVCDHDRAHTLTPDELRRVQRYGPTEDPSAIRAYLLRLRQQQPAHNLLSALRGETTATRIVRTRRRSA